MHPLGRRPRLFEIVRQRRGGAHLGIDVVPHQGAALLLPPRSWPGWPGVPDFARPPGLGRANIGEASSSTSSRWCCWAGQHLRFGSGGRLLAVALALHRPSTCATGSVLANASPTRRTGVIGALLIGRCWPQNALAPPPAAAVLCGRQEARHDNNTWRRGRTSTKGSGEHEEPPTTHRPLWPAWRCLGQPPAVTKTTTAHPRSGRLRRGSRRGRHHRVATQDLDPAPKCTGNAVSTRPTKARQEQRRARHLQARLPRPSDLRGTHRPDRDHDQRRHQGVDAVMISTTPRANPVGSTPPGSGRPSCLVARPPSGGREPVSTPSRLRRDRCGHGRHGARAPRHEGRWHSPPVRHPGRGQPERLDRRHEGALQDDKYAKLDLVDTVYGTTTPTSPTTRRWPWSTSTRT
jgi:hypothetical protein